jgi:hypothetical protein
MGHPVLRRLVQAFHVAVLPRQPHLAQRRRIPGAQARIAANPAFGACAGQPGLGAFADQGALELGRGAQDLQGELALRGGRVDRVHERAEEGALRLQPLDHLQQMRQRPRQTVDAHDDQRVALADPLQHPRQHGPRAVPARGLLLMDLGAARGFQGLRLGQGGLILGRDARIADQGHQRKGRGQIAHPVERLPAGDAAVQRGRGRAGKLSAQPDGDQLHCHVLRRPRLFRKSCA